MNEISSRVSLKPRVDFLITTMGNRPEVLQRAIAAATASGADNVFLLYQGSDRETAIGLQALFPAMKLEERVMNGLPAARHHLVQMVRNERPTQPRDHWVVFCDDDCLVGTDFCGQLVKHIESQPRIVGWGPVIEARGTWLRRAHRLAQLGAQRDARRLTQRRITQMTPVLFGCCMAFRLTALEHLNWRFRSGYALGEDFELCQNVTKAGGQLSFGKNLRATHLNHGSGRAGALQRGAAKGAWFRQLARSRGQRNPASLVHLALAASLAATGAGRERGHWQGLWRGLRRGEQNAEPPSGGADASSNDRQGPGAA